MRLSAPFNTNIMFDEGSFSLGSLAKTGALRMISSRLMGASSHWQHGTLSI